MKSFIAIAAAAGLLAGASFAQAQTPPGLQMQEKGSLKGTTGASGYAPGQQMKAKGSVKGTTGASGYAPGQATTGASVKGDADVKAGNTRVKTKTRIDGKATIR
jgi:hypothetical protein